MERGGAQISSPAILGLLKSLSLASACRTLEAPMRLERAAERVAANTPRVIRGAKMLMYCIRLQQSKNRLY